MSFGTGKVFLENKLKSALSLQYLGISPIGPYLGITTNVAEKKETLTD